MFAVELAGRFYRRSCIVSVSDEGGRDDVVLRMVVRGSRWGIIDIDDACGSVGVHDAIVFAVVVALAIWERYWLR